MYHLVVMEGEMVTVLFILIYFLLLGCRTTIITGRRVAHEKKTHVVCNFPPHFMRTRIDYCVGAINSACSCRECEDD